MTALSRALETVASRIGRSEMDIFPDLRAVGGVAELQSIAGALLTLVLIVAVLMMIICGITWALASGERALPDRNASTARALGGVQGGGPGRRGCGVDQLSSRVWPDPLGLRSGHWLDTPPDAQLDPHSYGGSHEWNRTYSESRPGTLSGRHAQPGGLDCWSI
jgi:hypothetical protein